MHKPAAIIVLALSTTTVGMVPAAPAFAQENNDSRKIEQLTREVEDLKTMVIQLQKQAGKGTRKPAPGASVSEGSTVSAPKPPAPVPQPVQPPPTVTTAAVSAPPAPPPSPPTAVASVSDASPTPAPPAGGAKSVVADLLRGVTINGTLDTYYEYNTNAPIGRVNSLRAYDVSSNNFSLNQAAFIVESAPDPANGKPFGVRFDLQYGQATATLQGNPANELRPEIYRAVYQAFGTYVVPVGNGLTVDFGKWASSLGMEGNYTKDQFNYSRSFWFNYLPFYHTGLRVKYPINDELAFNLWITNGTQQTEAFNNYKDQMYGLVWTPTPTVTWTLNYYRGQEHPDVTYLQNPGPGQQNLPNQQGTFFQPITNPPSGLLNIGDTYATWQVTPTFTLAAEADYVEQRLFSSSPPDHVYGGAVYAAYQLTSKLSVAARGEYLADRGGLFSGTTQNLKETTLTLGYRPAGDGFLLEAEYRRDWSNKPYFLGTTLGLLKQDQPTIGFGAVWWFGQKQGAW